jgi:hypothetical protein
MSDLAVWMQYCPPQACWGSLGRSELRVNGLEKLGVASLMTERKEVDVGSAKTNRNVVAWEHSTTRFQNLSLLPTCCLPGQRNETTNVVLGTSECRNTSVSSVNRKEGVLRRREGIGMCLD